MMRNKVAVFGEALFDLLQQSNGDYRPFVGGSPFNVARSFAKQGLDCCYLSRIGNDDLGSQIMHAAQLDGIQLPENNRSDKPTSLALVYKDANGQPSYQLYRKSVADLDMTAEQLLAIIPADVEVFHTGSLALVPEMIDVLTPVLIKLKNRGVKISIDINVRLGVELDHSQYVGAIWQFIALADIVKVSDEDLHLMGLQDDPIYHAAELLSVMNDGIVALTLGEQGAFIITDGLTVQQDIIPTRSFGDAVGAGDTFFSALISELLRNNALHRFAEKEQLQQGLLFGAMAASLNVSEIGCHPPSQQQVLNALALL